MWQNEFRKGQRRRHIAEIFPSHFPRISWKLLYSSTPNTRTDCDFAYFARLTPGNAFMLRIHLTRYAIFDFSFSSYFPLSWLCLVRLMTLTPRPSCGPCRRWLAIPIANHFNCSPRWKRRKLNGLSAITISSFINGWPILMAKKKKN